MSLTTVLKSYELLKEEISKLQPHQELRLSDFSLMLAKSNLCVSASSMSEIANLLIAQGCITRITKQRLAVAAREHFAFDRAIDQSEIPVQLRLANLETLFKDFNDRLEVVEGRLL